MSITPSPSESTAAQFCRDQTRPEANTVFDAIPDSGDQVPAICNAVRIDKTLEPKSMTEIYHQVRAVYGNWPKGCQGGLFVLDDVGDIRELKTASGLFGWMWSEAFVGWHTGANVITKGAFFRQLMERVEQYEAIETSPHYPPLEGHYYVNEPPAPGNGQTLERFLDFFAPSTDVDRQLILAMIVTTFWGGKPGGRPAFAIDSVDRGGAGKTTLATKVGTLAGGIFEFDLSTPPGRLRSDLVSEPGGARRMVLFDHARTSQVINSAIKLLITVRAISRHANYVGFRQRPNHLTWVITMNGMSLGRDMAHRTVRVLLAKPQYRAGWDAAVDNFMTTNRVALLADVAAFFERPQVVLGEYSRLSAWEEEVLSRLTDPESVRRAIKARMGGNDVDAASATTWV